MAQRIGRKQVTVKTYSRPRWAITNWAISKTIPTTTPGKVLK